MDRALWLYTGPFWRWMNGVKDDEAERRGSWVPDNDGPDLPALDILRLIGERGKETHVFLMSVIWISCSRILPSLILTNSSSNHVSLWSTICDLTLGGIPTSLPPHLKLRKVRPTNIEHDEISKFMSEMHMNSQNTLYFCYNATLSIGFFPSFSFLSFY